MFGWGVSFVFTLPVIRLCSVAIQYDSNSNDINSVMVLYSLCKERKKKSSQCCISTKKLCESVHARMRVCVCVHVRVCIYMCVYTCVCMCACIYIYTCVCV